MVIHVLKNLKSSFHRYSSNLMIITVISLILVELSTSCVSFYHCFHTPKGSLKDVSWKIEHTGVDVGIWTP